ncbi:hypothetical protein SDRG_12270 [Saprolegnia diclina VS20]|uniref:F-box domain-containing protein n=1 Tax=Saprolegnia diclina (strain VS20) TaxID=1156394 RepID=T0Q962_SAPDV|nr:hypothetical protein SDRG_12270 [Saprolegnia diclina VS20]EQC29990.1 hypothetical protein SDRG_12270 [Saprolegnia diclina VS20]|eukprot:XP_008616557.1 hypothetical protein SDRG_12270 [Saprolegnia diclina VS20]
MSSTAARTILDLDHALVTIAQFTPMTKDVAAFLSALPASARSASLTALHKLLADSAQVVRRNYRTALFQQDPEKAMSKLWPVLELSVVTSATAALALAAMPLFSSVALRNLDLTQNVLGYDHFQWLYLWRHKITNYAHSHVGRRHDIPRLCSILTQCTKLQGVDVHEGIESGAQILEAVTTPAHRVRCLTVCCLETSAEMIPVVARWLASGSAEHLHFTYYAYSDTPVSEALASMLCKTTTLSHLALTFQAPELLARLLPVAAAFTRLTHLHLAVPAANMPAVLTLLQHLRSPNLGSLCVGSTRGNLTEHLTALLDVLPTFPALEELTIQRWCLMDGVLEPARRSTFRRLTFSEVLLATSVWEGLATVLLRSCDLDEITWRNCRLWGNELECMTPALRGWIARGIRIITFDNCRLGDDQATMLGAAVARTTSAVGVSIVIKNNLLSGKSCVRLGRALLLCAGVSVVLPSMTIDDDFRDLATMHGVFYGHEVVDGQTYLVLKSPADRA